jgi:rhodanese-related sulfurtransferase
MGGIHVDAHMRTSDPRIWAVGDAVEVPHVPGGYPTLVLLAGPANRQGRVAADNIFGRERAFRGVQGTGVVGAFELQIAGTGCNEKRLRRAGVSDYEAVYVHADHHVGYYPGAQPMHVKLLFRRSDGRVLGAQIVGRQEVPRRIDVIAMAIQMEATVYDLAEAELCYSPQYGAPKDPVNLAGMVAANLLQGDCAQAPWSEIEKTDALLLDVRTPKEYLGRRVDGAPNIPLDELRQRLDELPTDREIWAYCSMGKRAYFAVRALEQSGRRAKNLPGGLTTFAALCSAD